MQFNRILLVVAGTCLALLPTARAAMSGANTAVRDPAFDSMVNQSVLDEASRGTNPEAMVDAAIMLDKAEHTLHRPHRGGTADDMFRYAWNAACSFKDDRAKERIQRYLHIERRDEFFHELEGMNPPTPEEPEAPISSGEEQEMFTDFINHGAIMLKSLNYQGVQELENKLNDPYCPLTPEDKQQLQVYFEKLEAQIYQATHNEDGSPIETPYHFGWRHDNDQPLPPPAPRPIEPIHPHHGHHLRPDPPEPVHPVVPPAPSEPPYRSRSLKAMFDITPHGARVISVFPGSPLYGRVGAYDVITAIDGMPATSQHELENHFGHTDIKFVDQYGEPQRCSIFIGNR